MAGLRPHQPLRAEGAPSSARSWQRLWLDGLDHAILLPRDPALGAALQGCLSGWRNRLLTETGASLSASQPLTVIAPQADGGFCAHSPYAEKPIEGLGTAGAVCAVIADITQAYSDTVSTHAFGLHCGGVAVGGQVLILAGDRRSGKSTLVARLSAEPGVTVLADDVLPLTATGEAVALGIAPRLRLPLPETASERFRAHVARWMGPSDDRYCFLRPPCLAPHGTRAPASVFLLLDRRDVGPAALHAIPAEETVKLILQRSIAGPDGPESTLAAAEALAGGLLGLRLVYSDLEAATAMILNTFSVDEGIGVTVLPPLTEAGPRPPTAERPWVDPALTFRRSPGTTVRRLGLSAFLWQPGDAMLWHLNPVAQAIWVLLEEPRSTDELACLLAELYPDEPPERLVSDVGQLMSVLQGNGLIQPLV